MFATTRPKKREIERQALARLDKKPKVPAARRKLSVEYGRLAGVIGPIFSLCLRLFLLDMPGKALGIRREFVEGVQCRIVRGQPSQGRSNQ